MGVANLWRQVQETAQHRNLAKIAWDGFEKNENGLRALRLGIDAIPWLIHAEKHDYGNAPVMEMMFWRLCRLLALGIKAFFVFDGRRLKHGRYIGGHGANPDEVLFRQLIEAFGFEWCCAHANAESELAELNRTGYIDAIMTDDVDTLLFGGVSIIRNWGVNLSGHGGGQAGKAAEAARRALHPLASDEEGPIGPKDVDQSSDWVYTFSAERIQRKTGLDRDALVFMAICSGGDFGLGEGGFGPITSRALAQCGFATDLCEIVRSHPQDLPYFLPRWREEIRQELRKNSRGFMSRKAPALANKMTDAFPDIDTLRMYLRPITSAIRPIRERSGDFSWSKSSDVSRLAELAYKSFEWPREEVGQRLRAKLWPGLVMEELRLAALHSAEPANDLRMLGNPGPKRERREMCRGEAHEYRIEIDPSGWAGLICATWPDGLDLNIAKSEARRIAEHEYYSEMKMATQGSPSKMREPLKLEDPFSSMRVWVPAVYLQLGAPGRIEEWQREREEKVTSRKRSPTKKRADKETQEGTPTKGRRAKKPQAQTSPEQAARKQTRMKRADGDAITASLLAPSSAHSSRTDLGFGGLGLSEDEGDVEQTPRHPMRNIAPSTSPSKSVHIISSDSSDDEVASPCKLPQAKKSPKKKRRTITAAGSAAPQSARATTMAGSFGAGGSDADDDVGELLPLYRRLPSPPKPSGSGRNGYESDSDAEPLSLSQIIGRKPPSPPDFTKAPQSPKPKARRGFKAINVTAAPDAEPVQVKPVAVNETAAAKKRVSKVNRIIELDD